MSPDISTRNIAALAKKEFMDNVRNKWILALSAIFILLAIVMSYFGGAMGGSGIGFQGFEETVSGISTIAAFLLPMIAILLGYGSIIGERENGSMGVVLGCPVSRVDVVVGKFAGLGAVLLATIIIGFGVSGLIVGIAAGFEGALKYILFMALSFMFAMFFLGFSIAMSAYANRRSTAIVGGLVIMFSGSISGTILAGIWAATGGDFTALIQQAGQGVMPEFPDWFWAGEFFSFMDIYPMGAMALFGQTEYFGFDMDLPWFINAPMIFAWFAFLTALTFAASLHVFGKRDI